MYSGQSKGDEAKKLLFANTDKALEEGAFGLPWFVGMHSSFYNFWLRCLC